MNRYENIDKPRPFSSHQKGSETTEKYQNSLQEAREFLENYLKDVKTLEVSKNSSREEKLVY